MRIDQIKEIAALMNDYDLSEFNLESEDMKLSMKRPTSQQVQPSPPMSPPQSVSPAAFQAAAEQQGGDSVAGEESGQEESADTINSPIVGTFYNAPAPDEEPFVKAGDVVEDETVVCIVEAMKVMNEIKAEKQGRIKRVLVENGMPVEYGQPLFELESA
ncbi:MAG: acetyl-CoA carboxylase biotin carboxyl carrier protein [Lentisphaeria bacterium]